MLKQQKGMTLLTLVLTIVVMLILAAIAIAMILDELKYNPEPVQVESNNPVTNTTETPEIIETPT